MISEEDKERIEAAMECNNCLCWHKYCNAECCRIIYVNTEPDRLKKKGKYINIRALVSKDDAWYYKLHGVKYAHGLLRFPKEHLINIDGTIVHYRKCDYLQDDLKCKGYPDNRPKLCKDFTEKDFTVNGKAQMTPNCLYKYKKMVKDYGKEE